MTTQNYGKGGAGIDGEAVGMQDGNSKSRRLNIERGTLEVGRGWQQLRSGLESLER